MCVVEDMKWVYCQEHYGENHTEKECLQKTEEIVDFANMVFSVAYSSTDFATLLPKAYAPERGGILTHHMIKEENRIKALIDVYPVKLQLKNKCSIQAVYIGTVSVHPNARGRGYMIELMKQVEKEVQRQDCALMILDGDRHRYQHYGFERAGIQYVFHIDKGNIKHCCAERYKEEPKSFLMYSFEELTAQSPHLDRLYELYQHRLVTARSREDFWLCMQSYNASVYAIFRQDELVGYVNLSEDKESVLEMEIADIGEFCKVLYNLMMEFDIEQLRVSAGMDEQDKIQELESACDSCSVSMSHQIKILDYEEVLTFLLNWKQQYNTLTIRDYVLGVKDDQTGSVENYLLSVTADEISVSRTEMTADTVLGALELVRILTTNLCFVEQQRGEQNKIKNAPAGWFPLPFYLPTADTF